QAIERAPGLAIVPEVAVDGLVADAQGAQPAPAAGDLLGAPGEPQAGDHLLPVRGGEAAIAPGVTAPGPGVALGRVRPVGAAGGPVPGQLAPDGARVPPQGAGDLAGGGPEGAEAGEVISFLKGDLAIRHVDLLSLGGDGESRASQVTLFLAQGPRTYYMNVPMPPNKRMDQSWRGRADGAGWHDCPSHRSFP